MNERQIHLPRRGLLTALAIGALGTNAAGQARKQDDPWPALATQIFNDRIIRDGTQVLAIDAPYRAEDAAVVPVGIRSLLREDDTRGIKSIALVIDENPSPLAAVFTFGATGGVRSLSTRVRVESYTNFHAVAELSDGQLYGAVRFVKAAGGCSAPAAKEDANAIPAGTMRFRQFADASDGDPARREVEFMVRHPNYSGMQMNQLTRLYVPARFVKSIRIWQGQDLLMAIESGISIAENPEYRFDYRPSGAAGFKADVEDSDGNSYHKEWAATAA
jgi:sulfur-oxidizing protein SoxY